MSVDPSSRATDSACGPGSDIKPKSERAGATTSTATFEPLTSICIWDPGGASASTACLIAADDSPRAAARAPLRCVNRLRLVQAVSENSK